MRCLRAFLHVQPISIRDSAQDFPYLNSLPVTDGFIGLLWVIVRVQFCFGVFDRWSHIFLKHPVIHGIIPGGFYVGEMARSCCNKISPNHDTYMLPCFTFGMRFFSCNAVFCLFQAHDLFCCPNNKMLVSSLQKKKLFQKNWSLCTFSLANLKLDFMFFCVSKVSFVPRLL
ncbi:hypothetical protein ILYODFUR_036142 [Ilyodon furcidens]|uniref:Uncharacterized protein n=1 Tax=Ilyodon furcidens TaxID=33524 RepID=A0ABV0TF71_9TELE